MEQENKVMLAEEYERMKIETEHDKAEVQVGNSFDISQRRYVIQQISRKIIVGIEACISTVIEHLCKSNLAHTQL